MLPKPGHDIPIWLGAVGRRGLDLVGRSADGWIPSLAYAPPDRVPAMIGRIEAGAAAAGRDLATIARIYNIVVSFTAAPEAELVSGPPAAIVERLVEFVRLGFTGFNFILDDPDEAGQVERLAREVIPAVRAAV